MTFFERETVIEILAAYLDQPMQVWFVKRSNGSKRYMRYNLPSDLRQRYNPYEKGVMCVVDLELSRAQDETAYRSINLDKVYRIESEEEIFKPEPPQPSADTLEEANREMDELFGY